MKVLFLSPNVPVPPENGGHHRILGLIRSLARFAEVHVLAIGDPLARRTGLARQAFSDLDVVIEAYRPTGPGRPERADERGVDRFPDAASHFRSPSLAEAISRAFSASRFDVAHVEEVVMAQYADRLRCPRILSRQKIDWAYHEAMADVSGRDAIMHLREAARFRYWERRLVGEFDRMVVPGATDRDMLAPLHGQDAVRIIPIAVADDLRPPTRPRGTIQYLLLYGARDYPPNVEAEAWFFRQVWPAVRRRLPHLGVTVVGSGRPPLLSASPPDDPRVEVRGFVPDVAPLLSGPGALIVPLRVGGGARTKVLEALACGMPVVSTALGVENLDVEPGRHFLLAETPEEVVAAVLRLTSDPGLVASLAHEAPQAAESHCWKRVEPLLEPIYQEVAASRSRPAPKTVSDHWGQELLVRLLAAERSARPRGATAWARSAAAEHLRHAHESLLATPPGQLVRTALDRILTPPAPGTPCTRARRWLARLVVRLVRRSAG